MALETGARVPDEESLRRAEQVGGLVMAARMALRRGQRDEAKSKLQAALALDPVDSAGLELLGDILLEDGDQEKAIRVFEHGLKYHPEHPAFEEKRGLAILDLNEMESDRILREKLLEEGEAAVLPDLKPARAVGLSLLPGAGHYYIGEEDRGLVFFGAWVAAFLGWYLPLHIGWNLLSARVAAVRGYKHTVGGALNELNGAAQTWFWLMVVVFVAVYLYAMVDSWHGVERVKNARRQSLGI